MWNEFTLLNYSKLKRIKKIYININSLFYKKINLHLNNLKNFNNIGYKIEKTKISKNKLDDMIDSIWVYNGIKNELDNLDKEYIISWNNNKIFLKCTKSKFHKIKKRLNHLIKIINYIKGTNTENLEIYLVLSQLKKNIDNEKKITPKNINSGYTHIINRYIFIWREEEFEKVLFHELIHFFNCDHREETYSYYTNYDSIFEAITDFKAIIYNLIYISYVTNCKLDKLINYEFSFIANQGSMFNYIIKNNNIKLLSPAYSYFVLKTMLLNYSISNDFDENDYENLFIHNKNFNKIIKKFNKLNENYFFNFNSCRMTFFELE